MENGSVGVMVDGGIGWGKDGCDGMEVGGDGILVKRAI
ncbi:hypothetical protein [Staphylococcus epidermidis]